MNSRERVMKTISHREPDRVPVGEWGIDHDHVSKIIGRHSYWRNRKDTALALWEGRRDEVVEGLKNDCVELVEKLDYDVVTVDLVPPENERPDPPEQIEDGVWRDKSGNIFKYCPANDSIMCMNHPPGKNKITEADIEEAHRMVENIDDSVFELIDFIGGRYGKEKAVLARVLDVHGVLARPFGGDQTHFLMLTALDPEQIKKLYAPGLAYNKKMIERCSKSNVLICMQGHDFGTNKGCLISPGCLRDFSFPFQRQVADMVKANRMLPFFHSCGNIWDIMDDFVDAGYAGYQSIQESAGMDIEKVKNEYGRLLTLWSGVQCETLVGGTMEELEHEVRSRLNILMPGGGFIFGSTNSVQYNAKTENYLRALDIVRKEGVY